MSRSHYEILFVDPDKAHLKRMEQIASANGWRYLSVSAGDTALEYFDRCEFEVVVMDLELDGLSGLQILEWIRTHPSSPEVIVLASHSSVEVAVRALKLGAFDYLVKPIEGDDRIIFSIRQAMEKFKLLNQLQSFQGQQGNQDSFEKIIGRNEKMKAVFELIRNVASSDSNVLIHGESGTGKELIARAIHRHGRRGEKPFVVINCAAMPETLLESELFGYIKGAFTGAQNDKRGLFEAASGGTVFLDEIGEVSVAIQVKLLRVIQEGEIRSLGDIKVKPVDVRVIAASNKELTQLIREDKFREDLYYRLNVINVHVPPLRERADDVPLLAYHFLKTISRKMNKEVMKIAVDALQALQNYSWPGNVRELENIMERAVVLTDGDTITAKSLPPKILSTTFYNVATTDDDLAELPYKEAKKRALNIFNRSYIISLLEKMNGNITAAAHKAGMDRSNFKKIIRKYRVEAKRGL